MKSLRPLTLSIIGVALAICSSQAQATIVNLSVYENDKNVDTSQLKLWVDVVDRGTGVDFVFYNESVQANILNIYFEGTNFSMAGLKNQNILNPESQNIHFVEGAKPSVPHGSLADFGGQWAGNLSSANAKPNKKSINPGESLAIRFDYNGIGYSDLLTNLSDPAGFRIAQHVQGLPGDASVWTISTPIHVPVPEPATLLVLAAGLPLLACRKRT